MPDLQTYRVLRAHEGDRAYQEGETRKGLAADLGHLVPLTLEPVASEQEKPAKAPAPAKRKPKAKE